MAREFRHWEKIKEYRGTEHEVDLAGSIKISPEYLKMGDKPETNYIPYKKAIELVKKFQPWEDPANPEKDFLRELRLAFIDKLGLKEKEMDKIKIYTAVGSHLDKWHGVDLFIEFEEKGEIKRVTVDVTLRPKKEEGYKADLTVVGELPDPEESEKAEKKYLENVEEIAEKMAEHIKSPGSYQDSLQIL